MVRILHISDSHAEGETMRRLNELAQQQVDCDVLAHTGDCVSKSSHRLPTEWDDWPQKVKLSVPGNHGDHSRTFESLRKWIHQTPWDRRLDDVLFIGFDLEQPKWAGYLYKRRNLREGARAVVLLSHYRPHVQYETKFARALAEFIEDRELLILHGDEHPKSFLGSEWDSRTSFRGRQIYRSNVCSSFSGYRGIGHRITWDGHSFACSRVSGESDSITSG